MWRNMQVGGIRLLSQQKSEAEVIPVVPDQDKIRNKNFDTKTSFRPKIKQKIHEAYSL